MNRNAMSPAPGDAPADGSLTQYLALLLGGVPIAWSLLELLLPNHVKLGPVGALGVLPALVGSVWVFVVAWRHSMGGTGLLPRRILRHLLGMALVVLPLSAGLHAFAPQGSWTHAAFMQESLARVAPDAGFGVLLLLVAFACAWYAWKLLELADGEGALSASPAGALAGAGAGAAAGGLSAFVASPRTVEAPPAGSGSGLGRDGPRPLATRQASASLDRDEADEAAVDEAVLSAAEDEAAASPSEAPKQPEPASPLSSLKPRSRELGIGLLSAPRALPRDEDSEAPSPSSADGDRADLQPPASTIAAPSPAPTAEAASSASLRVERDEEDPEEETEDRSAASLDPEAGFASAAHLSLASSLRVAGEKVPGDRAAADVQDGEAAPEELNSQSDSDPEILDAAALHAATEGPHDPLSVSTEPDPETERAEALPRPGGYLSAALAKRAAEERQDRAAPTEDDESTSLAMEPRDEPSAAAGLYEATDSAGSADSVAEESEPPAPKAASPARASDRATSPHRPSFGASISAPRPAPSAPATGGSSSGPAEDTEAGEADHSAEAEPAEAIAEPTASARNRPEELPEEWVDVVDEPNPAALLVDEIRADDGQPLATPEAIEEHWGGASEAADRATAAPSAHESADSSLPSLAWEEIIDPEETASEHPPSASGEVAIEELFEGSTAETAASAEDTEGAADSGQSAEDQAQPLAYAGLDPELYGRAMTQVVASRRCSVSLLQKGLDVSLAEAADIIEALDRDGIVGPQQASGRRKVLIKKSELDARLARLQA